MCPSYFPHFHLPVERSTSLCVYAVEEQGEIGQGEASQVIVANPLKSVVAMEIIATDVIVGGGGTDSSEGH